MDVARRNFAAIYVAHLATAIGMAAFIPFLPYYLADLGVRDATAQRLWAGVIVAGAPLMAAVFGPIWGALGDRIGRKVMVLRSLTSIIVFVGLMGTVTAAWQLLCLRLLQGVFSGFVAAGNTLVSVSTPVERQGRVLGSLQTGLLTGLALGPLLGGLIGDLAGHRPVFLVTSALAATAFLVVLVFAREDRAASRPAAAGVGLFRAVALDLRAFAGIRPLRQLLQSLFLCRTGLSMMIPLLPIYLVEIGGYPEAYRSTVASLLFVAVAAPTLLLASRWGRRADRRGPGGVFAFATALAALGFVPYALVGSAAGLVAVRILQGVFLAGVLPSAYAAVARLTPRSGRGASLGLTQASLQMAMATGPLLGGWLSTLVAIEWLFLLAAVLLGAAALTARLGWAGAVDRMPAPAGGARSGSGVPAGPDAGRMSA